MKLQIETKSTIDTKMETPSFFRSPVGIEYRAIFSENDFREVSQIGDSIFIRATACSVNMSNIVTAFLEWDKISEVEFMEKWDSVLESLSLTPTLKP